MSAFTPGADSWRFASHGARGFKEWHHVIVIVPGATFIVNVSVAAPATPDAPWIGRVIVLTRASTWTGFIESFEVDRTAVAAEQGRVLALGPHRFAVRERGYEVSIAAPAHGVHAALTLIPCTAPLVVHNQPIAPNRRLHWRAQPRIHAHGTVVVDGRRHRLRDALGYHDHNWGAFCWGDDFRWAWGIVLPEDPDEPWSVLYSELLNGARTLRSAEQVLVWRGSRNTFVAGSGDVESTAHGMLRDPAALRLPPVMGLLHPRVDRDVPARLAIDATNGADRVTIDFVPDDDAQIVIPSERDPLGVTTIHECFGRTHVSIEHEGALCTWRGHGVFEFVR